MKKRIGFAVSGLLAVCVCGRDLVWTGAQGSVWNLTDQNWYVAGDESKAPVAFESGDNALFDDSASSFTVVLTRVDTAQEYQFNVGNVVFSNEVQNYTFDSDAHNWIWQRGAFGTIDKWGAAPVFVSTRLDTAKDFTCHGGLWRCHVGSKWFGEFRSGVGSLHDARTVSFLGGSSFGLAGGYILGAPTSAPLLTFNFHGAALSVDAGSQNMGTAFFQDTSYAAAPNTWMFFTGDVNVDGSRPFVMNGCDAFLNVMGNGSAFRTITVADVTGDDGYDMVISNRLADTECEANGTKSLMNRLRKSGPGTLALMNAWSTTTGCIEVVEGTLAINGCSSWTSEGSSTIGLIDSADNAHARYVVRDGATISFDRNAVAGEINNPMRWELSVSNATLRLTEAVFQHFGTLRLHNATLDWQNAYQNTWFPYDFIGCSERLVLSGDTPYDFQPKGAHPAVAWLSDNCTFRLGFTLASERDDHPIAEAGTDPSSADWAKYSKFTNMWTVVDFVVEDITKDAGIDATMGWTVKDMPNMSYLNITSNEAWDRNPWKHYRFHGGVRKLGAGTFRMTGNNTYTHVTDVAEGALLVDGSIALSSGVIVAPGAYLGGTGVVSAVTFKDGGGLTVPFEPKRTALLRAPSVTAEGMVRVRVEGLGVANRGGFRQDVVQVTGRPSALDCSRWTVVPDDVSTTTGYRFAYSPETGTVSVSYAGGTMVLFR